MRPATRASPATPPTTPPAIAPASELCLAEAEVSGVALGDDDCATGTPAVEKAWFVVAEAIVDSAGIEVDDVKLAVTVTDTVAMDADVVAYSSTWMVEAVSPHQYVERVAPLNCSTRLCAQGTHQSIPEKRLTTEDNY
ncbi:hypothetical protein Tdes44962_MAKER08488 [Teratosphaeria destructans]|uniref:Uncharacterized protein n=1 Tax=Teratosphaeria destructans TaxID=418781 RepID=A0A9W7SX07_9PEZI|nr:hypothetical protein Tdes44962_MAKER08488 [Teratosphaeria destructans]